MAFGAGGGITTNPTPLPRLTVLLNRLPCILSTLFAIRPSAGQVETFSVNLNSFLHCASIRKLVLPSNRPISIY